MRAGLAGRWAAMLILGAALAGGCARTATLLAYPDFYDPAIQTVAVAPFANRTLHPMAGLYTANAVAAALTENGTYEVINPYELQRRWRAAGIEVVADDRPETIVQAVNDLGDGIDAVIVGTVVEFGVDAAIYGDDGGFYPSFGAGYTHGYARRGYYGYGAAWHPSWYRAYGAAEVAAGARMIRTDTGEVLRITREDSVSRQSSWHYARTGRVVRQAVGELAAEMVEAFAITPREVRIDRGRVLRTAQANGPETRRFTDDFNGSDDAVAVVVQLPLIAARNTFHLTAARADTGAQVAERVFTWPRDTTEMVLRFDLAELTAAGPGDVRLRLATGGRTAAERTIHIH
ncbi:MAG: hypothetical protein GX591_14210 [Planctomycetes bacterium]|nr:hypothetical protein [Planctomycetota bacterium]